MNLGLPQASLNAGETDALLAGLLAASGPCWRSSSA